MANNEKHNDTSLLSQLDIPAKERLILALDLPTPTQAKDLVLELGKSVSFYKIGLELFMTNGYFELLEWLKKHDKKVFVDLKFFDVPRTVAAAVHNLSLMGVDFATVHGNDSILAEAVAAKGAELKLLAVTALTSLDEGDLRDLGFSVDAKELVLSRAKRAVQLGCDGVISSGLEVAELKKVYQDKLIAVTPGIRPVQNQEDDQKRVVGVAEAFENGADYIVVGRPVHQAHEPRDAAESILESIRGIFGAN